MVYTQILASALVNGDVVRISGYRFAVYGIRREVERPHVVRFHGAILDKCDLFGTGYDGGTYGANEDVYYSVER